MWRHRTSQGSVHPPWNRCVLPPPVLSSTMQDVNISLKITTKTAFVIEVMLSIACNGIVGVHNRENWVTLDIWVGRNIAVVDAIMTRHYQKDSDIVNVLCNSYWAAIKRSNKISLPRPILHNINSPCTLTDSERKIVKGFFHLCHHSVWMSVKFPLNPSERDVTNAFVFALSFSVSGP